MTSKHNPIVNGNPEKDETIQPIKKRKDRNRLKKYWLNSLSHERTGRRNWMLFRLGMVTGLRASDLVKIKWNQIYNNNEPRDYIYGFRDTKTKKFNHYLNIKPIYEDLVVYRDYCKKNKIYTYYMFPSVNNFQTHIQAHTVYAFMTKAGDDLEIKGVGSHSIRKTFGYIAYKQTHDIGYVMKRLNHQDPAVTLRYIGMEKETMDQITESIDWN